MGTDALNTATPNLADLLADLPHQLSINSLNTTTPNLAYLLADLPPSQLSIDPLNTITPNLFAIVVTLQLTIIMQLKCSFSAIIIFNWCHFATNHLHAAKMLIFYCHHFQLWSFYTLPSSGVCPVYNIPSVCIKGTFSVLWSSAKFYSISQNMHYKAPVASQHCKTNKVVWTWKDDWPPRSTSTYERTFTQ